MLPRLVSDGEILTFDVIKTKPEDIKDTNGAGDAFVGGENGGIVLFNLGWYCSNYQLKRPVSQRIITLV